MIRYLPRWISASITKHLFDGLMAIGDDFTIFLEGMPRNKEGTIINTSQAITNTKPGSMADGNLYEVRIDGPNLLWLQDEDWETFTEVNIIFSAPLGEDLYALDRKIGMMITLFSKTISIMKLGDSDVDDGTHVGCIKLFMSGDKRERLVVSRFGQIDPSVPLLQASIEGHYKGVFTMLPES